MNENPNTDGAAPGASKAGTDALLADAKGVASHLASDAKEAVGKLAEDAKSEIEKRITSGKDEAARTVGGVAQVLRHSVEEMHGEGPLPRLADQAADRIEQVAEYVQSRTIGDLVREVERFARREPAIFLGSSFIVGLLGGRFLKSSATRGQQMDQGRSMSGEEGYQSGRPTQGSRPARNEAGRGGMQVTHIPGRAERAAAASVGSTASYRSNGPTPPGARRDGPTFGTTSMPTAPGSTSVNSEGSGDMSAPMGSPARSAASGSKPKSSASGSTIGNSSGISNGSDPRNASRT